MSVTSLGGGWIHVERREEGSSVIERLHGRRHCKGEGVGRRFAAPMQSAEAKIYIDHKPYLELNYFGKQIG